MTSGSDAFTEPRQHAPMAARRNRVPMKTEWTPGPAPPSQWRTSKCNARSAAQAVQKSERTRRSPVRGARDWLARRRPRKTAAMMQQKESSAHIHLSMPRVTLTASCTAGTVKPTACTRAQARTASTRCSHPMASRPGEAEAPPWPKALPTSMEEASSRASLGGRCAHRKSGTTNVATTACARQKRPIDAEDVTRRGARRPPVAQPPKVACVAMPRASRTSPACSKKRAGNSEKPVKQTAVPGPSATLDNSPSANDRSRTATHRIQAAKTVERTPARETAQFRLSMKAMTRRKEGTDASIAVE
mmetsp:Transcript_137582/g.427390  ORF Transcript_137582/g.427390 Transcript_137582/m.427390 type:complete len:303 (-) Transcript_137582:215-1123(-)